MKNPLKRSSAIDPKSAYARFTRLKAIERREADLCDLISQHKTHQMVPLEGRHGNLKEEIRRDNQRPPHVFGGRWMTAAEKEQNAAQQKELEAEIAAAQSVLQPLEDELALIRAEREEMEKNPAPVDPPALKAHRANINRIQSKHDKIEKLADEDGARSPTARIEALRKQEEALETDHDLLAVDIAIGEGSEADLEKTSTDLGRVRKQLSGLVEEANLSAAAQRGYERSLSLIREDLAEAEQGFRVMLSLYAKGIHNSAVRRLEDARAIIDESLTDVLIAQRISETYGDGSSTSNYSGQASIEFPGIHEIEPLRPRTDYEVINQKVEELLRGITGKG